MKTLTLPLSKNMEVTIDIEDKNLVSDYKWYAHKGTSGYYAATMIRNNDGSRGRIFMHRLLNNTPEGHETDHINHNTLDNTRSNLRTVTKSQNQHNTRLRKDSVSGFKGVGWHKATNKWRTRINKDGVTVFTAYFSTKIEAAKAYDTKAKELFGNYAKLNFEGDK